MLRSLRSFSLPRYISICGLDVGLELHRRRSCKLIYIGPPREGAHFAVLGYLTIGWGQIYAW